METIQEFAIANIVRVELVTEETTPKTYRLTDVATEAEVLAFISEGEEAELRVKNTIKAQNNWEDIVKGYDLRLVSATMVPQILALIDGGTLTFDDIDTDKVVSYEAPEVGIPVTRQAFTTNVYTEEKDADGSTVSYVQFSYKHCKGTPVNYSVQDGQFYAPEFNLKSRAKKGEKPVKVDFLDALPA